MLPKVEATGKLGADADFFPVTKEEGFLKFPLLCQREDTSASGVAAWSTFYCDIWTRHDDPRLGVLTKGTEVVILGKWQVAQKRGQDGISRTYHSIRLSKIEIVTKEKTCPSSRE